MLTNLRASVFPSCFLKAKNMEFMMELIRTSCHVTTTKNKARDISERWIKELKSHGVPEAELSVKYIMEKAMPQSLSMAKRDLNERQPLTENEVNAINQMCERRLNREPIQYIVGDWDFRYLTLAVKPPTFIPRPETEELVGIFNSYHFQSGSPSDFRFLEVGCGSGAISLSILFENPKVTGVTIDATTHAVDLTKQNALSYSLQDRLTVLHADIGDFRHHAKFDAIVSNPPYVLTQDMDDLQPEIDRYEDLKALRGGQDGMDVMKLILNASQHLLKPHGSIWFEMDLSHPPLVTKWLQDNPMLGLRLEKFYNDHTSRTRFCHLISQKSS